jgi:hypothetical protein
MFANAEKRTDSANHPALFRSCGTRAWQAQILSDETCPRNTRKFTKKKRFPSPEIFVPLSAFSGQNYRRFSVAPFCCLQGIRD